MSLPIFSAVGRAAFLWAVIPAGVAALRPLERGAFAAGQADLRQAGGSEKGRDLAVKHSDSIIAGANGIKGKKEFRDNIRRRAEKFGGNPDAIKILYLFNVVLRETNAEAKEKHARGIAQPRFIDRQLALIGGTTESCRRQMDDAVIRPLRDEMRRDLISKFEPTTEAGVRNIFDILLTTADSTVLGMSKLPDVFMTKEYQ